MRLVIIGAGGYGGTIADIAEQTEQYSEIILLDDADNEADVAGKCQDFQKFIDDETYFYPAFGCNSLRMEWLDRLTSSDCKIATLIHRLAYVSPKASIASGSVVMPYAVVNTFCEIRQGCIINCGAIVDHGCVIEEGVHVSPGAVIKAENQIPLGMKIEAGQVIENRTYKVKKEKV